mmetsp:Transcript_66057/g.157967  ORF Transcript_66057/g.157967 Transcript_66057/m.157967 type:complete len:239 (+) Transcript_66057:1065-1781(+)
MRRLCHKLVSAFLDCPFCICAKPKISWALDAARLFSPQRLFIADKRRLIMGSASGTAPLPRKISLIKGLKASIGCRCHTLQLTGAMPGRGGPSSSMSSSARQRRGLASILNCWPEGKSTSDSCGKAEHALTSVGAGTSSIPSATPGSMTKRTGSVSGVCSARSCQTLRGSLQADAKPSMINKLDNGFDGLKLYFFKSVRLRFTHRQDLPCHLLNFPVGSTIASCSTLTKGAKPIVCMV